MAAITMAKVNNATPLLYRGFHDGVSARTLYLAHSANNGI